MALRAVLLAAVLFGIGACSQASEPREPLKIWSVEVGTGVDAENRITTATRTFAPDSTVYVTIETKGAGRGTLIVDWAPGSRIVETQKREINPTKLERFAFHFVPPGGWPKGTSRVRFSLNDGEKHLADFLVE